MKELLEAYKKKKPEVIFEWNDAETEARGWVVINSLRNGAAGGGTRMRKGLTADEVVSLAKVMEIKFSVCGPNIGGAKSGIDFDPRDPRRQEVLKRWYAAVFPLLKNYYGTGGDLNVDELKDVVPITEELGLWHPQEGIVNGHFKSIGGAKIAILGQLRQGGAKIIEDPNFVPDNHRYTISDMITGYGVSESIGHYYDIFRNEPVEGKRMIVQGWGNVASAAALYLAHKGATLVGIIDKEEGLIKEEGFSFEEVKKLFVEKKGNKLNSPDALPFATINEKIWDIGAEIFIPGAASKLVSREQCEAMMEKGLEVISCGANVPFKDDGIFFGPTATMVDERISLIPDFIANCGMARVFAYFMQPEALMTDEAIFGDVSQTIQKALNTVKERSERNNRISDTALQIALEKLISV